MNLQFVTGDLFEAPQGFYLAHCISGDFSLGAGIAKTFDDVYNMRYKLHRDYPITNAKGYGYVGRALLVDNVFNLVTKARHYHKPTYDCIQDTLEDMKIQLINKDITKLAMPKIASGLDRVPWCDVQDMIEEVFEDMDIDILIYSLD